MADEKRAEELKQEILDLTREYHEAAFGGPAPEFVPGRTRVPYAGRVFDAAEMVNLVDSALEFWLTYGRFSEEFEQRFAAWVGVRDAYLVNSGSSANLLAVATLTSDKLGDRRLRHGDEVVTVAAGFPTTIAPVIQHGAIPVFVDVDPATHNATVASVREAISPRTRAIMLAHTLGNPFEAQQMRELADEHDIWLIEDNCDALGSVHRGRKTGTFGHIATSSFYPPHHLTMGEGGAVCTSDPLLASIALSMRDWGRDCICVSGQDNRCGRRFSQQFGTLPFGYDHKYVYSEWGYNLKATDMQAAVGVAQLDKIDGFVEARRANYARLHAALQPAAGVLVLPEATPQSQPSWFGYLMTVREDSGVERSAIVGALEAAGVQTRMLFAGNIVRQPVFDALRASAHGYRVVGDLENTDRIMRGGFWVGVYPGMSGAMIDHMAAVILDAAGVHA